MGETASTLSTVDHGDLIDETPYAVRPQNCPAPAQGERGMRSRPDLVSGTTSTLPSAASTDLLPPLPLSPLLAGVSHAMVTSSTNRPMHGFIRNCPEELVELTATL